MTSITLSSEQRVMILKILVEYLPANTNVGCFGSRAKGTSKPFSDLDLALHTKNEQAITAEILIDLNEAFDESDLPFKVDLLDLNTISPEFKAIVERDYLPLVQGVARLNIWR